jgi:hypothetical protein
MLRGAELLYMGAVQLLELRDLLDKAEIEPRRTIVMRHRPSEPGFRRVMPWIAAEHEDLFMAYQHTQDLREEKAMLEANHLISFIGMKPGEAVFVGIYGIGEARKLTYKQYWQVLEHRKLQQLGNTGFSIDEGRDTIRQFETPLLDHFAEWKGRMIVNWPGGERSWYRRAHKNEFRIKAINEASAFAPPMPNWDQMIVNWSDLPMLPSSWRASLSEWRGIYYIIDQSDGRGYIGSAYGKENILGRWRSYAQSGHGGNIELRKRDPENFIFSILQRLSPDLTAAEVIQIENSWKERLHARRFGLNKN